MVLRWVVTEGIWNSLFVVLFHPSCIRWVCFMFHDFAIQFTMNNFNKTRGERLSERRIVWSHPFLCLPTIIIPMKRRKKLFSLLKGTPRLSTTITSQIYEFQTTLNVERTLIRFEFFYFDIFQKMHLFWSLVLHWKICSKACS